MNMVDAKKERVELFEERFIEWMRKNGMSAKKSQIRTRYQSFFEKNEDMEVFLKRMIRNKIISEPEDNFYSGPGRPYKLYKLLV